MYKSFLTKSFVVIITVPPVDPSPKSTPEPPLITSINFIFSNGMLLISTPLPSIGFTATPSTIILVLFNAVSPYPLISTTPVPVYPFFTFTDVIFCSNSIILFEADSLISFSVIFCV